MIEVINLVQGILAEEPVVLHISEPLVIVGTLHGNFEDLKTILQNEGAPPSQTYLFLGNIVNQGKESMKTLLYILLLKIQNPNFVYILRGGHESLTANMIFGLHSEC